VNNFASTFGVDTTDAMHFDAKGISFKESCIQFMRAVGNDERHMLVFLDDVHYADDESVKVINALLKNKESRNKLFVFSLIKEDMKKELLSVFSPEEDKLQITNLGLGGLNVEAINQLLAEMLGRDESMISPLSEVVLAKTDGNPFFLKEYLFSLRNNGFLRYTKKEWTWNISSIKAGTNLSDNLLQNMETRIESLHPDVQSMLKIASCIGFQFPRDILDSFGLEYVANGDINLYESVRDHFSGCLKIAIQEGMIESTRNGNKFKFSHLSVRESVAELLPLTKLEQETLHLRIGNAAWNASDDGRREWYVLAAAEQLNKCINLIPENEKKHVQNVNIRAAKIARSRNAFAPSAEFLESAISLMKGKEEWRNQYQVMLTIHCMAAEMYTAAGLFDKCKAHVEDVFQNATTSFDKMPAYFVMTESLAMQCQVRETTDMAIKGLAQLGIKIRKIPKRIQLKYEMARIRYLLDGKRDDDILAMEEIKSKKKLAAMRLLGSLLSFSVFAGEHDLVNTVTMKMLRISLKEGVSRMMPAALACWSILNASDPEKRRRFGELARKLAIQMNDESPLLLTIMFAYGFSVHQQVPLKNTFCALDEGYNTGIDLGQVFSAAVCRTFYTAISLQTGVSLIDAEREARQLCSTLRERNQNFPLSCALPFWQVILNMMGDAENDNPSYLTGRAMNYHEAKCEAEKNNNRSVLYVIYYCTIFVSVFFGDWTKAWEHLQAIKSLGRTYENYFLAHGLKCFEGLTAYEKYRQTLKKSFLVAGRSILKELKVMSKHGNVTCKAFAFFIEAEEVAMKGNMTKTSKAFNKAISEFKQCKLLPFEALACERAGGFMLRENMTLLTEKFFTRSLHLFKRWGARTKVERLILITQEFPAASRHTHSHQSKRNGLKSPSASKMINPYGLGKNQRLSTFDTSFLSELDTCVTYF